MLLAIDVGNTNIAFGIHHQGQWRDHWRIRTVPDKMPDEYAVLFRDMIRDGVLVAAASGGTISYRSAAPVLGGGDERANFVLAVLKDFRYETLRATVNGEAAGESEFGIQLLGANPEVAEGDLSLLRLNAHLTGSAHLGASAWMEARAGHALILMSATLKKET